MRLITGFVLASLVMPSVFAQADGSRRLIDIYTKPEHATTAVNGSGYRSEQEKFVGTCIEGREVSTGVPTGSFSLTQSLSERQAKEQLGFGTSGRAQFGIVEGSASARFLQNSVSSNFSTSAIWLSDYLLPVRKLLEPRLTRVGNDVLGSARWAETCGDQFVSELVQGGKLFFSIRVDFTSVEKKAEFEAKFSISGPLASAEGNLNTATKDFSRDTRVTVAAFQMGGDVTKLTAILGDSQEARDGFVECTLGNFENCAKVISRAIAYAADTKQGFPSQLAEGAKPGAADLSYRMSTYLEAGIDLKDYPGIDQVTEMARDKLAKLLDDQFSYLVLGPRLLKFVPGKAQRQRIEEGLKQVESNIVRVLQASKTCYDKLDECSAAVQDLKSLSVDIEAFKLPPLATASFRVMTSHVGVWSRSDSSTEMMRFYEPGGCKTIQPPAGFRLGEGTVKIKRVISGRVARVGCLELNPGDSASVVLRINGTALREAEFFFEGKSTGRKVALDTEERSRDGRYGDDFALMVFNTSRQNPGWRDFDLELAHKYLVQADIMSADGIFYVLVRDAFGRESRFDLEYQKWETHTVKPQDVKLVRKWMKNRRWEASSEGTRVSGTGDWSDDWQSDEVVVN